jgi:hypothetical protein
VIFFPVKLESSIRVQGTRKFEQSVVGTSGTKLLGGVSADSETGVAFENESFCFFYHHSVSCD